jgi:hypothetical protein
MNLLEQIADMLDLTDEEKEEWIKLKEAYDRGDYETYCQLKEDDDETA